MDELIQQLQAKTGLGADQIKSVVAGVVDFIKDKLPEPLAGQITGLLEGGGGGGGGGAAGGLLDKANDLLGGLTGRDDA